MQRRFIHAALVASFGVFGTALAADINVHIGDPGYYGRLELGDSPKPVLISPTPVIIERERVVEQPTYVYVPAEQRSNWANYCSRYEACGRPVYFVEERWYNDVYVPHYKSTHELKKEAKQDLRDAKREAKDIKREAKQDYKDAKREAKDND